MNTFILENLIVILITATTIGLSTILSYAEIYGKNKIWQDILRLAVTIILIPTLAISIWYTHESWSQIPEPELFFILAGISILACSIPLSFMMYIKGGFAKTRKDSFEGMFFTLAFGLFALAFSSFVGWEAEWLIGDIGIGVIFGGFAALTFTLKEKMLIKVITALYFTAAYYQFGYLIGGMIAWLTFMPIVGWRGELKDHFTQS